MRPVLPLLLVLLAFATLSSTTGTGSTENPSVRGTLAAFTYEPCYMCMAPGYVMGFDASWSASIAGPIVVYSWDFGDGSPPLETTDPRVGHIFFTDEYTWRVSLKVQDEKGNVDTISQLVSYMAVPRFTFKPENPIVRRPVMFDASSSEVRGDPSVVVFSWDFGDGGVDSGAIVKHAYLAPGLYRVVLTFSTVYGDLSISKTLKVGTPMGSGGGPHYFI